MSAYEVGTIVQITNESHAWFPCLVVITEVKGWGVQGYVSMPTGNGIGNAFIRLKHDEIEWVGRAVVYMQRNQEAKGGGA